MNIASVASVPTKPDPCWPGGIGRPGIPEKPPILHLPESLGTVKTLFLGKYGVSQQLRAAGAAGAWDGYATLADAARELGAISKGDHNGAIAVVSQFGRFYGEHVRGFSPEAGGLMGAVHVEHAVPDISQVFHAGYAGPSTAIAALVDGDRVLVSDVTWR